MEVKKKLKIVLWTVTSLFSSFRCIQASPSMKIVDILKGRASSIPSFSFEFFPARSLAKEKPLLDNIASLKKSEPKFVSITWGAGGSSAEKSLSLAIHLQKNLNLTTCLHITTNNITSFEVLEVLDRAYSAGIRNLLVLRGDRFQEKYSTRGTISESLLKDNKTVDLDKTTIFNTPQEVNKPVNPSSTPEFKYASDLISFIKVHFQDKFCIGVGAYPEKFPESADIKEDYTNLLRKLTLGADFIMTQYFFDVLNYSNWVKSLRELGIKAPIIPEVMIIQNYQAFLRLQNLTNVHLPKDILSQIEANKEDKDKFKSMGIEIATKVAKDLNASLAKEDLPCLHFCTLNSASSTLEVLHNLRW